ncbi:MAG TPA: hypothetical protein VGG94_00800 [Chthoniobacterales bacterium]|jgi:hypothetical protein
MKLLAACATAVFALALAPLLGAQVAAPPSVDLPEPSPAERAAPPPLPSIAPDVPELSQLDEAFKRTSIGKAGDEFRQRVEIRRLQNRVGNDEDIIAAKRLAEAATTDLQKRERLREYYDLYYGRMRQFASSEETRKALDELKATHVNLLAQPRVRPIAGQPLPPVAKKDKSAKPKKSRFGRTTGQ